MYTYTHTHTRTHTHKHTHTHTHTRTHTLTVYTHVFIHKHKHKHPPPHTPTLTHQHTHTGALFGVTCYGCARANGSRQNFAAASDWHRWLHFWGNASNLVLYYGLSRAEPGHKDLCQTHKDMCETHRDIHVWDMLPIADRVALNFEIIFKTFSDKFSLESQYILNTLSWESPKFQTCFPVSKQSPRRSKDRSENPNILSLISSMSGWQWRRCSIHESRTYCYSCLHESRSTYESRTCHGSCLHEPRTKYEPRTSNMDDTQYTSHEPNFVRVCVSHELHLSYEPVTVLSEWVTNHI